MPKAGSKLKKPRNVVAKLGRNTEYKPEYCEMLIKHMTKGHSFESFCADVNVGAYTTLYRWVKNHPDFSQAKEQGERLARKTLEELGLNQIKTGQGNASAWIFWMKNRYGWRDKKEVELTGDPDKPLTITVDSMSREERLKKLQALEGGNDIDTIEAEVLERLDEV